MSFEVRVFQKLAATRVDETPSLDKTSQRLINRHTSETLASAGNNKLRMMAIGSVKTRQNKPEAYQ
ncbi:MAG: hypothetical protein EBZ58_11785 [Bacteroidetes bacterium]|nr:hypothetical protein [Bacteroidota bacterium]